MDSSGEGADWFFIGTAVEAATQTSLPVGSEPITAATQTVQAAAAAAPCIADLGNTLAGNTLAAVAVAGVAGVSAGALFVHWWTSRSSIKVVPASEPLADSGGVLTSPGVVSQEFVPQPSLPPKDWLPYFAIAPLPLLEPVLPRLWPRLELMPPCTVPIAEWFSSPPCAAPIPERFSSSQTSPNAPASFQPSRPLLAGAVVGLGFAALASAGLLGRWLWKRAGIGLAAQCQKSSLCTPKVNDAMIFANVQQSRSSAGVNAFAASSSKSVCQMPSPISKEKAVRRWPAGDLSGRRFSPDLTEGGVDVGFEILRRAGRARSGASCQAEVYVLGGIVRPAPPTSSHIFRMLPKQ